MKALFVVFAFLATSAALAHPVIYKGGTSLQSFNSQNENDLQVLHSFERWFSGGMRYIRTEESRQESHILMAQGYLLAKRWNLESSQANILLGAGAGQQSRALTSQPVYLTDVSGDWESRRLYSKIEFQKIFRPQARESDKKMLRLGFAPFLADYNDLSVWVIAEGLQTTTESVQYNQFLRFYYRNVLWEIGTGLGGSFLFNFMVHY